MIEAHEYSMAQLEEILSALDGQKRRPCSKKAAIKAINKKAKEMGLVVEDVFATADLLLGGVVTHEEWRASLLRDDAAAEAEAQIEDETAIKTAIDEIAKTVDITEEEIAEIRAKQDRFLATVSNLDAAAEEPEEAAPDEPVETIILPNAGPLAEDEPEEFVDPEFAAFKKTRKSRANSKQARVIAMLRRPEGATVLQISEEMGWLKHTTRAFVSATLGKKLGLNVTSGKIDGQRVYRIED